jgi:hypothetical protein
MSVDLNRIFNKLFPMRGGYSLPVLVSLRHAGNPIREEWLLTSAAAAVAFEGREYEPAAMEYAPPQTQGGMRRGGRLRIAVGDDNLVNWLDAADSGVEATVVAVILEPGEDPLPTGRLRHKHGDVSWDGEAIVWTLSEDDRLQMLINPWKFDASALSG